MIKLEVHREKKSIKDSFVIRTNEAMRISVDLSDTGHLIVYEYQGTEDVVSPDFIGNFHSQPHLFILIGEV